MDNSHYLEDGARIAVIGGGPSGSFFSIFALQMAEMIGRELQVTIYEPRDFNKSGPAGCNKCGGIISELLVQSLAVEGINLPGSLVQRGINSYRLHTDCGHVSIATPMLEKTIASVCRGGGPTGIRGEKIESFDNYLLSLACEKGAKHEPVRINKVDFTSGKPVLFSRDCELGQADLVVGAYGINSSSVEIAGNPKLGNLKPRVVKTAIAEIVMDQDILHQRLGSSINLFLLQKKNLKFAAIIPKGTYATVCILGRHIDSNTVEDFLSHPVVERVVPKDSYELCCRCYPKMNVAAPARAFRDRMVICGDAGSTRLFKDGIGAAYLMGKAAAITAVFQGVGARHFRKFYHPVYKSLIVDNRFGMILFFITGLFKRNSFLTKVMLEAVRIEQGDPADPKVMSSILWDMFTGNERYRSIFWRNFRFRMHKNLFKGIKRIMMHS